MKKCLFILLAIILFTRSGVFVPVYGAEEKIIITGNKLIYDYKNGVAEVIGKVKIVRNKSMITAEKLKSFFLEGDFYKVELQGKVKFNFKNERNIKGESDLAIYFVEENKLILSGNNRPVKVWQDRNEISGKKIIIINKEGEERIIVEEEVKAVYMEEKEG